MIVIEDTFESDLGEDSEAAWTPTQNPPEQAALVSGARAINGEQISVRLVDLKLVDMVKRQTVAAKEVTVAPRLYVSADSDARALSMRNGHALAIEPGGNIGQKGASAYCGVTLAILLTDLDIVVQVHTEQNGVVSAGR